MAETCNHDSDTSALQCQEFSSFIVVRQTDVMGQSGHKCLNTILFLGHSYIFVIISYLVTTYMQNPAPKHAEKVDFSLYTNIYEPSENKMNVNPAF